MISLKDRVALKDFWKVGEILNKELIRSKYWKNMLGIDKDSLRLSPKSMYHTCQTMRTIVMKEPQWMKIVLKMLASNSSCML